MDRLDSESWGADPIPRVVLAQYPERPITILAGCGR